MKRMPSPSAAAISALSASGRIMVPVGLAGLATSTPLSGVRRWVAIRASTGIDQRLAAERREDMTVRRIARARDRDPVTRLEQRQKRQDEGRRGAGGHHDLLG